ncbi:MAG: DUF2868 domain-containing protein [Pseudomonadales bacterium]|nr:DUF2868 domain-containing protein [Pseudomonadales bacterium]
MLRLDAEDAAALLLVHAAEEAGLRPVPVSGPGASGDAATRLAADARARVEADPRLARVHGRRAWLTGARPGPWLVLVALLAGVATSSLSAGGRLNVLTPPLLGLVLWHVLTYLLLALRPVLGRRAVPSALRGLLARAAERAARLGLGQGEDAARLPGAFARDFARSAPKLVGARLAATLHGAAAAFALGAIAGLYLEGLGVAYRAYWESTFLAPGTVTTLVGVLLAPASALTGIPLPDEAAVAAMAETPVPAAPWIHLWAATLAAVAVVPRALLAGVALLGTRRARTVVLDPATPWVQRALAAVEGHALRVRLQPLGYRPGAGALEQLQDRLRERLGGRIDLARNDPLPWDAEAGDVETGDAERLVLLLNPAQTPEEDVHGPLLTALARRLPVTVALDAGAYRTSPERRASRIAGWERLLAAVGTDALPLEPA